MYTYTVIRMPSITQLSRGPMGAHTVEILTWNPQLAPYLLEWIHRFVASDTVPQSLMMNRCESEVQLSKMSKHDHKLRLPSGRLTQLLNIAIHSWFTFEKWWFSIANCFLFYQRWSTSQSGRIWVWHFSDRGSQMPRITSVPVPVSTDFYHQQFGWLVIEPPLWKIVSSSVGLIWNPMMFQSTNQSTNHLDLTWLK